MDETHKQTEDSANSRSILEAQLRDCFARAAYTHKTHEKCADIARDKEAKLRVGQIILSALTTGGFIGVIIWAKPWAAIVGAFVSTGLLILNAYMKQYNLSELAAAHKLAAADLWLIRERYLSLLTDLAMGERPIEHLQSTRDELLIAYHAILKTAPITTSAGYSRAQKALQRDEELTFNEGEIDAFLPKHLRRGQ